MIKSIDHPMALAVVRWRAASDGGRVSGPPTAAVYAATAVFPRGEDESLLPGWPGSGEHLSVLLQLVEQSQSGGVYKVDFLARDLAQPLIQRSANMLIMEGPRVVGDATIQEVFGAYDRT